MTSDKKNLPTIIPLAQAVERSGLPESVLQRHIEAGTLQAQQLSNGEVYVNADQAEKLASKQAIIQEKFGHLVGQGISLTQAARKYKVSRPTIRNWVYRNKYVHLIDTDSYPQLADEAEVAYCAEIYHQRKAINFRAGAPLLDEYGLPYTNLKHPTLSQKRRKQRKTQQNPPSRAE